MTAAPLVLPSVRYWQRYCSNGQGQSLNDADAVVAQAGAEPAEAAAEMTGQTMNDGVHLAEHAPSSIFCWGSLTSRGRTPARAWGVWR
ncbi:hypothetical protein ART_4175 [Arthrobacter sp. PAMC 25486]|nr:hypothetical protein ART_4175 [Arthrobacter sp. PAMC 25486]